MQSLTSKIKLFPALRALMVVGLLHSVLSIMSQPALLSETAIAEDGTEIADPEIEALAELLRKDAVFESWSEVNLVRATHLIDQAPIQAGRQDEPVTAQDWLRGHCNRNNRAIDRAGEADGLFTGKREQYHQLTALTNEQIACAVALSWFENPDRVGELPNGLVPESTLKD